MFCTAVSIIFSRKDKMIKTPQAVPHITRMTRIGFSSGDENPSIQLFIILSSQMLSIQPPMLRVAHSSPLLA
jgi:hypothetical protein